MADDSTRTSARDAAAPVDERAAAIRFITKEVSEEETAAVTAVLLALLDEGEASVRVEEPRRSAWVRSAPILRAPLSIGPGEWVRSVR
jgi:hypothetical protein